MKKLLILFLLLIATQAGAFDLQKGHLQRADGTTDVGDLAVTDLTVGDNAAADASILFDTASDKITAGYFVGTGAGQLNDMTPGGTYTGAAGSTTTYRVKIDATGTPDTFTWSDDGGSTWDATGVAITGAAQTLNDGVTVTFAATTGHTLNSYKEFTALSDGTLTWDNTNLRLALDRPLSISIPSLYSYPVLCLHSGLAISGVSCAVYTHGGGMVNIATATNGESLAGGVRIGTRNNKTEDDTATAWDTGGFDQWSWNSGGSDGTAMASANWSRILQTGAVTGKTYPKQSAYRATRTYLTTGTVTDAVGLVVENPTTSGTVLTTNKGIEVKTQTAGATNYELYMGDNGEITSQDGLFSADRGVRNKTIAASVVTAGSTIDVSDSCGGILQISSASEVATSSAAAFTAPSAGNAGCIIAVRNVGLYSIHIREGTDFFEGDNSLGILVSPYTTIVIGRAASGTGSDNWEVLTPPFRFGVEQVHRTILSSADIRALNGTPVKITPDPFASAGYIDFHRAVLVFDATATPYDGIGATEDLVIITENTGTVRATIETTGFLDQTTDQMRMVTNVFNNSDTNAYDSSDLGRPLLLKMLNGEIATGTGILNVYVYYSYIYN